MNFHIGVSILFAIYLILLIFLMYLDLCLYLKCKKEIRFFIIQFITQIFLYIVLLFYYGILYIDVNNAFINNERLSDTRIVYDTVNVVILLIVSNFRNPANLPKKSD